MAARNDEEDLDSILSGIMNKSRNGAGNDNSPPNKQKKLRRRNKAKEEHSLSMNVPHSKNVRPKTKLWVKVLLLALFSMLIVVALIFFLSGPLSRLLTPSPFSSEIKNSVDFALYYPTSLPEGFKIETDSIKEAENGVVIYAISNGSGKRVTVSAQKAPENIDINALYSSFDDTYELETGSDTIRVAKTGDNIHIANLVRRDTWLLINTPNGNLSTEEFNQILSSIREG